MNAQQIGAKLDAAALALWAGLKADAAQARHDVAKLGGKAAALRVPVPAFITRIPFAIAVLTGRIVTPSTVTEMELKAMLDKLTALVATGQAAAQRLIDKGATDATTAADLQQKVDNFEADAIAAVQPFVDQVVGAAPEAPAAE